MIFQPETEGEITPPKQRIAFECHKMSSVIRPGDRIAIETETRWFGKLLTSIEIYTLDEPSR